MHAIVGSAAHEIIMWMRSCVQEHIVVLRAADEKRTDLWQLRAGDVMHGCPTLFLLRRTNAENGTTLRFDRVRAWTLPARLTPLRADGRDRRNAFHAAGLEPLGT